MLSGFRRGGLTQIFLGGIVFLIIGAFAFDFRGNQGGAQAECAAEVKGVCVPPREFTAAFRMIVRPELTAKQIRRLGLRKMVMDGLVERELLLDVANEWGIGVTDEALDKELSLGRFHFSLPVERDAQMPMVTYVNVRHPKTNKFNYDLYKRMVRNYARMSGKDFREYQTRELTAARVRDVVKGEAHFSEAEALSQYRFTRSKVTTRTALLSREWFARFLTPLGDAEVDAYISAQSEAVEAAWASQGEAFAPGCVLIQEITFRYPPASDAEDKAKTQALANQVRDKLRGADAERFARYARLYGAGETAWHGGYRGCLDEKDETSAKLLQAVADEPDGSLSKVLEFPNAMRIVRRIGSLPTEEEPAQAQAKRFVARPLALRVAAEARVEEFAKQLIEALAKGESMQEALDRLTQEQLATDAPSLELPARKERALASQERPRVDVSPAFTRTDPLQPVSGALPTTPAKQLAFALAKVGDVHPEPIPTLEGAAVLQLKEKNEATREEFEAEKEEVLRQIKQRASSAALQRFVEHLRSRAEGQIQVNPAFLDPPEEAEEES